MVPLKIQLPEGFLDEEVRCGYTVTRQMKEVWAIELDLLTELLRVCDKYNIKIFASGGTLLGAVRHKGFIPWDDDIDMMMFREDYEKLCNVAKDEFEYPYFFQTEYTDPGSLRCNAQLRNSMTTAILTVENDDRSQTHKYNQGIFIDIMPLDNIVMESKLLDKQKEDVNSYWEKAHKMAKITNRYASYAHRKINKFFKPFVHLICSPVISGLHMEERYYKKYENACKRYNNKKTKHVGVLMFAFRADRHIKDRDDFEKITYVPFEFMQIPAGTGYDHALKRLYGDYTVCRKASSEHGGVIFDVDRPYTEYVK